jgi:hypothetical protein
MKLPRRWWLAVPAVGFLGGLAAPWVYEQRHLPAELRAPTVVSDPSLEADLACSVEAACGPLRAPATLTFAADGADPVVEPAGALPPGYAGCARRTVGAAITGRFELAPCARR